MVADRDALDVVAFNLMLAVQASADLAAHIIADEGTSRASDHNSATTIVERR